VGKLVNNFASGVRGGERNLVGLGVRGWGDKSWAGGVDGQSSASKSSDDGGARYALSITGKAGEDSIGLEGRDNLSPNNIF
jgi:hypothetical protein